MTDTQSKDAYVRQLCDTVVASMSEEVKSKMVWDIIHDEFIQLSWSDLQMHAEDYGVNE